MMTEALSFMCPFAWKTLVAGRPRVSPGTYSSPTLALHSAPSLPLSLPSLPPPINIPTTSREAAGTPEATAFKAACARADERGQTWGADLCVKPNLSSSGRLLPAPVFNLAKKGQSLLRSQWETINNTVYKVWGKEDG